MQLIKQDVPRKSKEHGVYRKVRRQYLGTEYDVDRDTGEISSTRDRYRDQAVKSKFATMYLDDENVYEFIKALGNKGQVLVYILKDYNDKTGMFYFSNTTKELMMSKLGLSMGTIRSIVKDFADNELVIHIGGSEYMVNPRCFYKGHQSNYERIVEAFDHLKKLAALRKIENKSNEKRA